MYDSVVNVQLDYFPQTMMLARSVLEITIMSELFLPYANVTFNEYNAANYSSKAGIKAQFQANQTAFAGSFEQYVRDGISLFNQFYSPAGQLDATNSNVQKECNYDSLKSKIQNFNITLQSLNQQLQNCTTFGNCEYLAIQINITVRQIVDTTTSLRVCEEYQVEQLADTMTQLRAAWGLPILPFLSILPSDLKDYYSSVLGLDLDSPIFDLQIQSCAIQNQALQQEIWDYFATGCEYNLCYA